MITAKNNSIIWLVFVFLFASQVEVHAQYTNTHYIAPSPWSYFNRYNELVVTTLSTTAVPVTISASDGTVYSNSNTTVAGTPLRYRFPALNASANASGTVLTNAGLIVSASVPIGVQVRNIASDNYTTSGNGPGDLTPCVQKGNSAFTSLGDQGLGTSFRLGYYANVTGTACYSETGAPLYSVMAIRNNTIIQFNSSSFITLNAGQSYLFQTNFGGILTANNPVVVNSGMRGDNSSGCGDGVESQVIPIANLGTTYVVVRSNGNTGYERSTIIATQANTTVSVFTPSTNTTTNYTLSTAGSFVTINNGDGSTAFTANYITASSPVAVYSGTADGCEVDMIVQPPLGNCSGSFDVQTNQFLNNANGNNTPFPYFGYVLIQSDTAIVYFNGQNLESIVGARTAIGNTGYYLIKYTNTQLGNPTNLRFIVNARINVALVESGAGYSMSAFISSVSNALPPPTVTSYCLPSTFTAQSGFSSYQWYKDNVLISGATAQTYSPTQSGSYTVTGTSTTCGTSAQSTPVVINPQPNAGNDFSVCAGTSTNITGSWTSGTPVWYLQPDNNAGASISNTNSSGMASVSFANAASGKYNVIFSVGCTDTLSIQVNPLPNVSAIGGNTALSVANAGLLTNTLSGGIWTSSNLTVATINASTGVVTPIALGTSTITYTVTDSKGCTASTSTIVTINPQSNP